jgi:hypothetical protein
MLEIMIGSETTATNSLLAMLEAALKSEHRTMKRQELLRRIWRVHRSIEPLPTGQLSIKTTRREKLAMSARDFTPTGKVELTSVS